MCEYKNHLYCINKEIPFKSNDFRVQGVSFCGVESVYIDIEVEFTYLYKDEEYKDIEIEFIGGHVFPIRNREELGVITMSDLEFSDITPLFKQLKINLVEEALETLRREL